MISHFVPQVADLKHRLQGETRVSCKRQKLIGMKTRGGKLASDADVVGDLAIKDGAKIMMMGWVNVIA